MRVTQKDVAKGCIDPDALGKARDIAEVSVRIDEPHADESCASPHLSATPTVHVAASTPLTWSAAEEAAKDATSLAGDEDGPGTPVPEMSLDARKDQGGTSSEIDATMMAVAEAATEAPAAAGAAPGDWRLLRLPAFMAHLATPMSLVEPDADDALLHPIWQDGTWTGTL